MSVEKQLCVRVRVKYREKSSGIYGAKAWTVFLYKLRKIHDEIAQTIMNIN